MKKKPLSLSAISIIFLLTCSSLYAGQSGYASWYGGEFHGRKTANGEVFDTYKFTAAHKTLPFDTVLKVTNLDNGKSTIVRINDRGPFVADRVIDLSFAAAKEIEMINSGIAKVSIEIIEGNGDKTDNYIYKIQVGAYSNKNNAEKIITKLVSHGLKADIEKASTGVFRVVLADIEKESLEKIEKTLKKSGFNNYLLKKEIKL